MFRYALPLLAASAALPACAQPAPTTDADPALWVVKDADTTVYLFGTIHVLKPGLSWFDEAVKDAFDKSGTLVLEMVEPDTATQQRIVGAKALAPAGPPLSEQIPADKRAAFRAAVAASGTPAAVFERMRPWFASITLSIGPVQKIGYLPENGPETVLSEAARAANKPVQGLETFEGQLSIFDGLSQPAAIQLLTSTVDELPTLPETMGRMVADWASGNPDGLAREMNDSLKDSPEVAKALLTDRNARWATWIAGRMKRPGTVFVAVGAGHLAGPGSVQAQLAKYRLKATRVNY